MITHYFSFPGPHHSQIDASFEAIFPSSEHQSKIHISEEEIFNRTSEFQNPSQIKSKITWTSSGSGILRMISHALSLQPLRFAVSYVGESAKWDSQITYFIENSKINTLILNVLGEQAQLINGKSPGPIDMRLGAVRQNIGQTRLFLADSTFIFFNINALKWADAPAQKGNNPSGLTSEEANHLAFLAGQSPKNKYFVVYGLDELARDPHGISINTALQMIWYYQYGALQKAQPWPVAEEHLQDFTIESAMAPYNFTFRKDRLTGNWFHQIPFELSDEMNEHRWIASSHEEYLATAHDDLPHRLLAWYDVLEV